MAKRHSGVDAVRSVREGERRGNTYGSAASTTHEGMSNTGRASSAAREVDTSGHSGASGRTA
jgi:hypothetical protein